MSRDLVLDVLESALALAQTTVDAAPAPDDDPDLVEDLRGLVAALHFLVRRYRDAITPVNSDAPS